MGLLCDVRRVFFSCIARYTEPKGWTFPGLHLDLADVLAGGMGYRNRYSDGDEYGNGGERLVRGDVGR